MTIKDKKIKRKKLKIRWAIDPFANERDSWKRLSEVLKLLSKDYELYVIPTYFLSKDISRFFGNYVQLSRKKIKHRLETIVDFKLEKFNLEGLQKVDIQLTPGFTRRADAKSFSDLVSMDKTDLVIISKTKRNPVGKFVLGSFLRSFIQQSKVPSLIIPNTNKKITSLDKAFYPTDLSSNDLKLFKKFIRSKINFLKEFVVYNKFYNSVPEMVYDLSEVFKGEVVEVEDFLITAEKKAKKELNHWVVAGKINGFNVKQVFQENSNYLPLAIINNASETNCDLIVIPSFVRGIDQMYIGSSALEVCRLSKIPVLVWKEFKK